MYVQFLPADRSHSAWFRFASIQQDRTFLMFYTYMYVYMEGVMTNNHEPREEIASIGSQGGNITIALFLCFVPANPCQHIAQFRQHEEDDQPWRAMATDVRVQTHVHVTLKVYLYTPQLHLTDW